MSPEAMMTPRSRILLPRRRLQLSLTLVEEVREEAADERGRVEFEWQVHAEREDQ